MAKTRNGVIAALDIGTSKVVCFVARVDGQGLRVVGIGHQPAQGMRSGNIVDMEAATRAISSAVSTAEEMCGEHVREVIVGVSGGSAASATQGHGLAACTSRYAARNASDAFAAKRSSTVALAGALFVPNRSEALKAASELR